MESFLNNAPPIAPPRKSARLKWTPNPLLERHCQDNPDPLYVTVPPPEFIIKRRVEDVLDDDHQQVFSRAVRNITSTHLAIKTFAQIADGLPLRDVVLENDEGAIPDDDPVSDHVALCPGAWEAGKEFLAELDPVGLEIAVTALQRYQETAVGSDDSEMPFLELVAVATHTIAVNLYKLDLGLHKHAAQPSGENSKKNDQLGRWSLPFCVRFYARKEYPDGPADAAGYWAENRIFGGVVLFGRGDDGTGHDGVYFHSQRQSVPMRIYKLDKEQKASLLRFLKMAKVEDDDSASPLPILGDRRNRDRVDPEIAMPEFNIYRDRWERTVKFENWLRYRPSCPRTAFEYPELEAGQRKLIEFMLRERSMESASSSEMTNPEPN